MSSEPVPFEQIDQQAREELLHSGKKKIKIKGHEKLYASLTTKKVLNYILSYGSTTKNYSPKGSLRLIFKEYQRDLGLLSIGDKPTPSKAKTKEIHQQQKREQAELTTTLREVFKPWKEFVVTTGAWTNICPKDKKTHIGVLEKHLISALGDKPIVEITSLDVLTILAPICRHSANTGQKYIQLFRQFFDDYEDLQGNSKFRNPFNKSLLNRLKQAKRDGEQNKKNYSAPHYSFIPLLMKTLKDLSKNSDSAALVFFQILLVTRNEAIRYAKWADFDFSEKNKGHLLIPVENNKVKRAKEECRTIYFGQKARDLLEALYEWQINNHTLSDYVLPSGIGKQSKKVESARASGNSQPPTKTLKPLSENAVNQFMQRVFHLKELRSGRLWIDPDNKGLIQAQGTARACFKTWALESLDENGIPKYSNDVIEFCLLHKKQDPYRGAYDRSKIDLEKVYTLKNDWESYCLSLTDFFENDPMPSSASNGEETSVSDRLRLDYLVHGGERYKAKIEGKERKIQNKLFKDNYKAEKKSQK